MKMAMKNDDEKKEDCKNASSEKEDILENSGESDEFDNTDLTEAYFKWIYHLLLKLESPYLINNYKIRYPFRFHRDYFAHEILFKFINSTLQLINFVPPSILRLSKDQYTSPQPHFTIRSDPIYIVKTGN